MAESSTGGLDISLDGATATALKDGGYWLYALFAVEMSNAAARPTIWIATDNLSTKMHFTWSMAVSAYTSFSQIVDGGSIQFAFQAPIKLGQTLKVSAGGYGEVVTEGPPSLISIANTTSTPFTAGLARGLGTSLTPIFAAPLYGRQTNLVVPLPKILLEFSTRKLAAGTVLDSFVPSSALIASFTESLLLTVPESGVREVAYNINKGWEWGGEPWAQTYPADADLAKILIESG